MLYMASFLLAAGEAIYSPVRKSTIPLLVTKDSLLTVNGLEQLMSGCVLILGAFSGGVVSMWFGPDAAFIMNAVSFLIAAMLIYGIEFPQHTEMATVAKKATYSPEGDLEKSAEEAKYGRLRALGMVIGGSLTLQVIFGYELLVPLLNGLDNVLISVYAIQVFHTGDKKGTADCSHRRAFARRCIIDGHQCQQSFCGSINVIHSAVICRGDGECLSGYACYAENAICYTALCVWTSVCSRKYAAGVIYAVHRVAIRRGGAKNGRVCWGSGICRSCAFACRISGVRSKKKRT
nr:MFS transporter [Paenibacillus odorifer]